MSTIKQYSKNIFNQDDRKFAGYLDIDRVKANPIYQCVISKKITKGATYSAIHGVYNSDTPFTISTGSNYEDQFEIPFQDEINHAMAGVNWLRNMQNQSQFIFKSLRMSEQRWTGSEPPTFSIRLDIPIVRKSDAPWKMIDYCLQATCGTRNEHGGHNQVQRTESGFQIFAPNGYRIVYSQDAHSSDTPLGTYAISLGVGDKCWFRMTDALITSMNATIGNKKYYDGNPTTVSIDVGFKFWRYPLYEDIIKWFPLMHR